MKNKKYRTDGTIPKISTDGTIPKISTDGTIPKIKYQNRRKRQNQ
jgi:hypothetical protein